MVQNKFTAFLKSGFVESLGSDGISGGVSELDVQSIGFKWNGRGVGSGKGEDVVRIKIDRRLLNP